MAHQGRNTENMDPVSHITTSRKSWKKLSEARTTSAQGKEKGNSLERFFWTRLLQDTSLISVRMQGFNIQRSEKQAAWWGSTPMMQNGYDALTTPSLQTSILLQNSLLWLCHFTSHQIHCEYRTKRKTSFWQIFAKRTWMPPWRLKLYEMTHSLKTFS